MQKLLLSVCFFFLFSFSSQGKKFDFNVRCQDAYDKIMRLQLSDAQLLITNEMTDNPDNLIPYFLENYIDFFTVFLNENTNEFKRLAKNKDIRLDMMEKGDKNSPYYLYTKAEINLQWAFARAKFEEYMAAFWEVRRAYKMLEENKSKFPKFIPNNKGLGVIHALIGTVPDNYKWGVSILGLSGNIQQGMEELKTVVYQPRTAFAFQQEATVLYVFFTKHLANDNDAAWKIIQTPLMFSIKDNLLNHFVVANIAMHSGRNDECINILFSRPTGKEYPDFPFMDYMLGLSKLYALDKDANVFLEKFTKEYVGQNYLKDSYQKLAWYYLIKGDTVNYRKYINICKVKGKAAMDADKQAQKEAESGVIPNAVLLKARLLSDGEYFVRAVSVFSGKSTKDFTIPKDKIEFTYRAGRIYEAWGKSEKAIAYYETTLKNGEDYDFYYIANAALHLGLIYEKAGNFAKAKDYFHQCLDMDPEEYKNSINQKAKAGLNRLKSKS